MASSMLMARPSAQATSISPSDRSARAWARASGRWISSGGCFTAHKLLECFGGSSQAHRHLRPAAEVGHVGEVVEDQRDPGPFADELHAFERLQTMPPGGVQVAGLGGYPPQDVQLAG